MIFLVAQAITQDPLWFRTLNLPILSSFIGAAIALTGAYWIERVRTRREKERAVAALLGEIHSIKKFFGHANFFAGLDYTIEAMTSNKKTEWFRTWITADFFKTYVSNPSMVGFLPSDVAREVSYFYALAFSVFERLKEIPESEKVDTTNIPPLQPLMFHKSIRTSAAEMLTLADKIIASLEKI
jgi:hypothetical protein